MLFTLKISVSPTDPAHQEGKRNRPALKEKAPQTLLLNCARCVKQMTAVGWEAWTHGVFTGRSEAPSEPVQGEIH